MFKLTEKIKLGRILRIAIVFLLLVFGTDRLLTRYFEKENLVIRLNGKSLSALPYLIDQYRKQDGYGVVFLGSSVLAGNAYTYPDEAAPALTEKLLKTRYRMDGIRCYNFAGPGFTMGDMHLMLSRISQWPPDLLVLAVNVKFFCREVYEAAPVRYAPLWSVAQKEDREAIAALAGLGKVKRFESRLNGWVKDHWALPRLLPLWAELGLGKQNPLGRALMEKVAAPIDPKIVDVNVPKPFLRTPYRWKRLEQEAIDHLRKAYADLPPRKENTNFFFMEELLKQAKKKHIPVLAYITPFNDEMNRELKLLDRAAYDRFRKEVGALLSEQGMELYDNTDLVDFQWFGDLDHLLYKGHESLASAFASTIATEFQEKMP